jgi:hypothetical protein
MSTENRSVFLPIHNIGKCVGCDGDYVNREQKCVSTDTQYREVCRL